MSAEEIRRLRESLGLTQERFAALVGVTGNTVARWERGEMRMQPAMDKLVRLSVEAHHTTNPATKRKRTVS